MAQPTRAPSAVDAGRTYDKIKFIGMFVGSALAGVVLVLLAVYNASTELAIVQEISAMHDMTQGRLAKVAGLRQVDISEEAIGRLAASLSTDDYPVLPVYAKEPGGGVPEWRGVRISTERIERSRINARGGYFEEGAEIYTWSLLALPDSDHRLLMLHRHQPLAARALFGIYQSRLIVPAAFSVWMTVWISLMLNGLVTRLRAQKEAVEHLAWHDALTGLPNRNLFFKTLDELVGRARTEGGTFSLAVVDLDGFKQVNDTYGHDAGDALLLQVADRFRRTVRQEDMVARTGGDEFILLFPDSDVESCRAVCDRMVQELRGEYLVLGQRVRIGASMGVARFPQDANEIVELTRKADKSMYLAKRAGGGVVCYSD